MGPWLRMRKPCPRRARLKAGSLDLDFPEMKIRLNERGRIARIERVENRLLVSSDPDRMPDVRHLVPEAFGLEEAPAQAV